MKSATQRVAGGLLPWVIGGGGHAVCASTYPDRPVRLIVTYTAGGPADLAARTLAQKLGEAWGQQVVVDNRAGAGGRTRAVNRVPACGM